MGGEYSKIARTINNLPVNHHVDKNEVRVYTYPDVKHYPGISNQTVKNHIRMYLRYHIVKNGVNFSNLDGYTNSIYDCYLKSKNSRGKIKTGKFVRQIRSKPINHDVKTDMINSMKYYTKY